MSSTPSDTRRRATMEKMAEPTGAGELAISGIVTAQGNAMRARVADAAGRWHGRCVAGCSVVERAVV